MKEANIEFPEAHNEREEILKYDCPDCERNNEFRVLETVIPADIRKGTSGQYRCQCTLCDYTTIIQGKAHRKSYRKKKQKPKE